jgi:hypothetical protein
MAGNVPGSAAVGQTVGHGEIPWLGRFDVAHSEIRTRLLTVGGVGRLQPMAASELAPVLGEHWRGDGGEKKYCGAKRFDFSHLSFSGLDQTFSNVEKFDAISDVGLKSVTNTNFRVRS